MNVKLSKKTVSLILKNEEDYKKIKDLKSLIDFRPIDLDKLKEDLKLNLDTFNPMLLELYGSILLDMEVEFSKI